MLRGLRPRLRLKLKLMLMLLEIRTMPTMLKTT
jgi:hypothetical protein